MAGEYLTHRTLEGDRWDLLAHKYYGDALFIEPILTANPSVASLTILPSGLTLRIPLIDKEDVNPSLPGDVPWR